MKTKFKKILQNRQDNDENKKFNTTQTRFSAAKERRIIIVGGKIS